MLDLIKTYAWFYFPVLRDRRAAGALEYALLVSFIAMAIVGSVTTFGTNLSTFFSTLATKVSAFNT